VKSQTVECRSCNPGDENDKIKSDTCFFLECYFALDVDNLEMPRNNLIMPLELVWYNNRKPT